MDTIYDPGLGANLVRDEDDRVRMITHIDTYPVLEAGSARAAALAYLKTLVDSAGFASISLENAGRPVSYLDPEPGGEEFRLRDEHSVFDTTTVAFNQAFLNLPVWGSGITVTMKQGPWRALSATDTSEIGIDASMPSDEAIRRFRRLFATGEKRDQPARPPLHAAPVAMDSFEPGDGGLLGELLGVDSQSAGIAAGKPAGPRLIRGRFYVYRHLARARLEATGGEPGKGSTDADDQPLCGTPPPFPFPIPPLPDGIRDGGWYVVAELVFRLPAGGGVAMNWRALVEAETGAVLFLRALTSGVNGLVFIYDPITSTGVAANTPNQGAAVLDPLRDDVTLPNLDPPSGGTQALAGTFAEVADINGPAVAVPTQPTGTDFDYGSRTNNFAAVNAYYHVDRFFQLVQSLGFNTSTYFNGTAFPVQVDHRGMTDPVDCPAGNCINAQCPGDGDGIDYVQFALAHTGDTANPIGIASDWRVVLHELGGHGIMHDFVGTANFGEFTNSNGAIKNRVHSFGDSFAMALNDFGSEWHNGAAIDRFVLAPFVPGVPRRSDRTVAAGWGWGGASDLGNYNSEQILSTCMFRFYRSIGGDSTSLARREFAARAASYLMLRAVSTLTPLSNPNTPEGILQALKTADAGDWTSESLAGGAYGKVLTWAFEEQNLGGGAAPAVDVYIDDGRGGEYPFQAVHWANGSIWNRRMADGDPGHQEPALGEVNYAYVHVKNRGTATATDVVVRGYHCKPSAGVTYPIDFDPMTTPQMSAGTVAPNNTETKLVGPFEWTPTTNAFGHDCMLMIVSATGDPSNVDNLGMGEVYADWRLVPNDNNVGQRNVELAPAGGGLAGLMAGLNGKGFWLGNPSRRAALLDAEIALPHVLAEASWRILIPEIPKGGLRAKPGQRHLVTLDVKPGREITAAQIAAAEDRDIIITGTADGAPVGGMAYRLDPDLKAPYNEGRGKDRPGSEDPQGKTGEGGHAQDFRRGYPWLVILPLLLIIALLLALLLLRP